MEFQEIRYFLAMSQTLNFTKAAEQCQVSSACPDARYPKNGG